MKSEPEHPLYFDYKGEADEYTHVYWDYAIPSGDERLWCCYENYRLIQVNVKNGRIYEEIAYISGITISGYFLLFPIFLTLLNFFFGRFMG